LPVSLAQQLPRDDADERQAAAAAMRAALNALKRGYQLTRIRPHRDLT